VRDFAVSDSKPISAARDAVGIVLRDECAGQEAMNSAVLDYDVVGVNLNTVSLAIPKLTIS
jgi:hypothetical protein